VDTISIDSIPQLDIDMAYDGQDVGNQNVVHPIFIPILYFTVFIGA
jgi:hypothetical protein